MLGSKNRQKRRQGLEGRGSFVLPPLCLEFISQLSHLLKNPALTLAHPEHPLTPALSHLTLISVHCNDFLTCSSPPTPLEVAGRQEQVPAS